MELNEIMDGFENDGWIRPDKVMEREQASPNPLYREIRTCQPKKPSFKKREMISGIGHHIDWGSCEPYVPSVDFDANIFDVNKLYPPFEINKKGETIMVKKVIFDTNGNKTIVFWTDNTKTIVGLAEGDKYDKEKAFMAAFTKKTSGKMYRTMLRKYIAENLETYQGADARWITAREYADMHHMHRNDVLYMIKAGKVPGAKRGNHPTIRGTKNVWFIPVK